MDSNGWRTYLVPVGWRITRLGYTDRYQNERGETEELYIITRPQLPTLYFVKVWKSGSHASIVPLDEWDVELHLLAWYDGWNNDRWDKMG